LISTRKNISQFSAYPGEGLLSAKQLIADSARESGKYIFQV